jgi:hypothetical protein
MPTAKQKRPAANINRHHEKPPVLRRFPDEDFLRPEEPPPALLLFDLGFCAALRTTGNQP